MLHVTQWGRRHGTGNSAVRASASRLARPTPFERHECRGTMEAPPRTGKPWKTLCWARNPCRRSRRSVPSTSSRACASCCERGRTRIEEIAALEKPTFATRRRAARGAAAPRLANLVAREPPQRRAEFRCAARRLQRLPAAALRLPDGPFPERAALSRLPHIAEQEGAALGPVERRSSSTRCATSASPASAWMRRARSASRR